MKIFRGYQKSAIYNIGHNKVYAAFYIIGTALTFVFITLVLQMTYIITYDNPPFINVDRTIHLSEFEDVNGDYLGGIPPYMIRPVMDGIKGKECYTLSNTEGINTEIQGKIRPLEVAFVDADYWKINAFEFRDGRPFTKDDIDNQQQTAVITEYLANSYFRGNALGKSIAIQGKTYKISGIVKDYSALANPYVTANVWIPWVFNKFVPSCNDYYELDIMFPADMSPADMKQQVASSIKMLYDHANVDVAISKESLYTVSEAKSAAFGGSVLFYSVGGILLLLLLIPALNILLLSSATVTNRASEIAIRRAVGATQRSSFIQIISENFILVAIGVIAGLILIFPIRTLIENMFFQNSSTSVLTNSAISVWVALWIAILAIVFTLLSGGLPAYMMSKKNIANILKGGSK